MSASLVRRNYGVKKFTDDSVDVSDLSDLLSPFQIEKLSYLFKCLDQTGTGFIDVIEWNIFVLQKFCLFDVGGRHQTPGRASPQHCWMGERGP